MDPKNPIVDGQTRLTQAALAARAGARGALDDFSSQLLPLVRAVIRGTMATESHRHDDAEGFVMVKLTERLDDHLLQFDPSRGSAEGYYRKICARLVSRFRKYERADVRKVAHAVSGEIDAEVHSGETNLEVELENRALLRVFRQIVEALDPIDKQVVWMRAIEGLSAKVVAERMDNNSVWVDQRYKRARARIIEELEQKTGESIANLLALLLAFLTLDFLNGILLTFV